MNGRARELVFGDDVLRRVSLSLKVLAVFVCIFAALSGHYPPAHAQRLSQPDSQIQMPSQLAVSPYDPEFASDISGLNDHLKNTDSNVKELTTRVDTLSGDVREMNGSMKVYFWLLSGIITGSIVIPRLPALKGKEGSNE